MRLFYSTNIQESNIQLDENDSRHLVKVLRLKPGDIVNVVDGQGNVYQTEVSTPNSKKAILSILNIEEQTPLPYNLHVAIAPTKNIDRLEWFIEKAVEMGISEITPILCDSSERKIVKPERLERIAIAAMKQSLKAYLPKINPLTKLEDVIKSDSKSDKFIAHCETPLQRNALNPTTSKNAIVLIGPEGDFSQNEIQLALENNFKPISLGTSRLRTETAGIFVVSEFYSEYSQI